jgi:hypothetical protein
MLRFIYLKNSEIMSLKKYSNCVLCIFYQNIYFGYLYQYIEIILYENKSICGFCFLWFEIQKLMVCVSATTSQSLFSLHSHNIHDLESNPQLVL